MHYIRELLTQSNTISNKETRDINGINSETFNELYNSIESYHNMYILGFIVAIPIGILINIFSFSEKNTLNLPQLICLILSFLSIIYLLKLFRQGNQNLNSTNTFYKKEDTTLPLIITISLFYISSQLFFLSLSTSNIILIYFWIYIKIIATLIIFFTSIYLINFKQIKEFKFARYHSEYFTWFRFFTHYLSIFILSSIFLIFLHNESHNHNNDITIIHLFGIFFIIIAMSTLVLYYNIILNIMLKSLQLKNMNSLNTEKNLSNEGQLHDPKDSYQNL
jgi:hypothetical protein